MIPTEAQDQRLRQKQAACVTSRFGCRPVHCLVHSHTYTPLQVPGTASAVADPADAPAADGGARSPSGDGGGTSPTDPGPLPTPPPAATAAAAASTSGRVTPLTGGNSESRSMADSRVKKFHKLLGQHVVRRPLAPTRRRRHRVVTPLRTFVLMDIELGCGGVCVSWTCAGCQTLRAHGAQFARSHCALGARVGNPPGTVAYMSACLPILSAANRGCMSFQSP